MNVAHISSDCGLNVSERDQSVSECGSHFKQIRVSFDRFKIVSFSHKPGHPLLQSAPVFTMAYAIVNIDFSVIKTKTKHES